MRKELFPALLAAALVGSACQRPPENPSPQRTPLAASGEPRPSSLEAEIQARVRATMTAQPTTPDAQVILPNPTIGNATRGSKLFVQKGCTACHMLAGVKEATGTIGPDLTGVVTRPRIPSSTGEVKNTPEEMHRWLMNPASIKSSTIMPPLGLTNAETRDIVSFLTQSAPQPSRPAEAQKPAGGEKVAIRLKPEELSQKLLITPLPDNELPPGFTLIRGKSARPLSTTYQALKAILQVYVLVVENTTQGFANNGEISYTIFPNASSSKGAYDMLATLPNSRPLKNDFGYPAVALFDRQVPEIGLSVVLANETLVVATFVSFDKTSPEIRATLLAQAGVKHLQRVGR